MILTKIISIVSILYINFKSKIFNKKVMKELQKLFTSLSFSNQKYIDPSHLLKKTIGTDGKPVFVGNQEDVAGENSQQKFFSFTF